MIVPLVIILALAILAIIWPDEEAAVLLKIYTILEEIANDIHEGVEEPQDRAN